MKKTITLDSEYKVSNKNVYLTVIIGEAQPGSSIVEINGKRIKKGKISDLKLGIGNSLIGKKLNIFTTVQDYWVNHNNTSVTAILQGGAETKKYYCFATVDVDKDFIDYDYNIDFKN